METPPVQYVKTSDGFSIAYAVSGQGRPVIWVPHFFSHIEVYWTQATFIRPWLEGLASRFQLIQYDGRGQGMSSRGLAEDHSLADQVRDLEAVVAHLKLKSFVLVATNWQGHVAVRYAVLNPERVEALVLQACPISGSTMPNSRFLEPLARGDWDAFVRNISAQGLPSDVSRSVSRLKQTVTQHDWLAMSRGAAMSDIEALLPLVQVPTLVIHPRDFFGLAPEESIKLASRIPGARVTLTDGATTPGDPIQGIKAIEGFLASIQARPARDGDTLQIADGLSSTLSSREIEVLRLIVAGRSNQQIADELVISLNTVRRHVSNIFAKTGAANRAAAAIYARDHGLA